MGDTEYICSTLKHQPTAAQLEAARKRAEQRKRQAAAIQRNRQIRRDSQGCDKHGRELAIDATR